MAYAETDAYDPESPGPYWHDQLENAQKVFDQWETRARRVVKRYRDERDAIEYPRMKFNILWSNIQVLFPSLYGRQAKPEVSRRYMDADPVGRLASTMLERVIEFETQQFPDYDSAMRGVVEDRLLPGRGTAWIRYAPTITDTTQYAPADTDEEGQITNSEEPSERVDAAHSPIDYVYWADFLHSPARTWDEVWWVGRWVYMTREEGEERFGDIFKNVPMNSQDTDKDSKQSVQGRASYDKKAKVCEIWNKRTGKVCWVAKGYPTALDERDDPLQLDEFFPCPRPLLATTTNGSMIPVPDYCEYEDQAQELDNLTQRIYLLVKATKAVGVFNAEFKELGRLFSEGVDNKLFPVTAWAAMSEKNGLKGAIDMLDISTVIQALNQLYAAREATKQTIYEIMGISDILRGSSNAAETLGAQQLKANFGSLRLRASQGDVARFATDLFRLKAQIICKFYPPELIVEMSGVMNTPDGQDPQLLQAALQMLANGTIRDFHISVESDSLAQIDDQAEKAAATEAIGAIGGFLAQAIPMVAGAPETLPMASEMLLFLVRRFRAGRGLESAIERAMKALEQKAQAAAQAAAQQPPQNPEMMKVQAQQQLEQAKLQASAQSDQMRVQADAQAAQLKAQLDAQMHQSKINADMQLEQMKAQIADQQMQHEMAMEQQKMAAQEQYDRWKVELEAATKIMVARIGANPGLDLALSEAQQAASEKVSAELGENVKIAIDHMANMHEEMMNRIGGVIQTLAAPKRIVRGADGRAVGVEVAT